MMAASGWASMNMPAAMPRSSRRWGDHLAFQCHGYLTSDAADLLAASLRAACMMPGPGLLRLPTEAARMVYIEDFSRLRERDRMGYIAFGFTAVPMGGVGAAALDIGDLTVSSKRPFGAVSALQGFF